MPMRGFDDEFVDIADYIIRITDRIWHERKVELCQRYYTADCVIHTMVGDISGADTVEANTHATLAAFPDRTLDGDNVIWAGNEQDGYYSSHLITSRMTNDGPSEFGPPTGKLARIRTIADCLCRDNRIFKEWLARDNAGLVQQLGLDVAKVAHQQALLDREAGRNLIATLSGVREQISQHHHKTSVPLPSPEERPEEFAREVIHGIWRGDAEDLIGRAFDFRCASHLPAGRDTYGPIEYLAYVNALRNALSDIHVSIDHVASIPYLGEAKDIAVRWSLRGLHTGSGTWGEATDAPIYLLGMSHWRVINGRIREEWTVFDELALQRQIEAARLA